MSLPALDSQVRRRWLRRIVWAAASIGICYAAYVGFWWYQLKRFQVVASGTLIRSAQPTEFGLEYLVKRHGVRTVVSLQLFDFRLYRSLFDPGEADGSKESEFVRQLGARAVQWPMGDETCWPWPDPYELEEFFHLLDNPANRPVLIHCMGGRHRTGTFSALYRLEYDRWHADEALAEMLSFNFGHLIPIHELNLRTYEPRPLPDAAAWRDLAAAFGLQESDSPVDTLPVLVYRIRADEAEGPLRRKFEEFATSRHAFALPLASRVVSEVDDPLLERLLPVARSVLDTPTADGVNHTAAASLIADFGSPDDQRTLIEALKRDVISATPSAHYEALVAGIMNRYTANRLPFLRVLLDDDRPRIGRGGDRYTYAVAAVGRIAVIADELPVDQWLEQHYATLGKQAALAWFDEHPASLQLARLMPPQGRRLALAGDGPQEEDLSRMRK